jgi:hypothetical protein
MVESFKSNNQIGNPARCLAKRIIEIALGFMRFWKRFDIGRFKECGQLQARAGVP